MKTEEPTKKKGIDFRIPFDAAAITALITPFHENGRIDRDGYAKLIEFQAKQGIRGIAPLGPTGEAATLNETEHCGMISCGIQNAGEMFVLSGCGSNCTREAMSYVREVTECGGNPVTKCGGNHEKKFGAKGVILVTPYVNGPSSLEIMCEYFEPIAKAFPELLIMPELNPGRTGCQLFADDLATLASSFPNIFVVKDSTRDLDNMRKIRALTPSGFQIYSGNDDQTCQMMTDPKINASGVISVISNIAPAAVQEMCMAITRADLFAAEEIRAKLQPLFDIVTVSATRPGAAGLLADRFSSPLSIKMMMNVLGMPAGPCRQSLGKMSVTAMQKVRKALETVYRESPEILAPIGKFFRDKAGDLVDIEARIAKDCLWYDLCY